MSDSDNILGDAELKAAISDAMRSGESASLFESAPYWNTPKMVGPRPPFQTPNDWMDLLHRVESGHHIRFRESV